MTPAILQALAERAGALLLIVAIVGIVAPILVRSRAVMIAVMVMVAVAALAPLGDLSAVNRVYSVNGPLGGASLIMLIAAIVGAVRPESLRPGRLGLPVLAIILVVAGIPFYAMVLGVGSFDPYRFGFGGSELPVALAAVLVLGFVTRSAAVALWIALSGVLYLAGAYTSRNLFDYLIDPLAVLLAIIVLAAALIRRWRAA